MKKVLVGVFRWYQKHISPWHKACCRFYPTCSQYAIEAVQTRGAIVGLYLALHRVLKCHPFHKGGYDPVPPKKQRMDKTL